MKLRWISIPLAAMIGLAYSQTAAVTIAPPPKFEVISIKPCKNQNIVPGGRGEGRGGGEIRSSPGRLSLECQTVASMIQSAYREFVNGKPRPINATTGVPEGGPMSPRQREQAIPKTTSAWITSELYSVDAKTESAQTIEMMRGPMMQGLLRDRFKLKIHREAKDIPVYALTVDKRGPKLQSAKEGSCVTVKDLLAKGPPPEPKPGQLPPPLCDIMSRSTTGAVNWYRAPMASLCRDLSLLLDRDVIDKTGIVGVFDIHMEFSPADVANLPGLPDTLTDTASPAHATDPVGSSIFAAVTTLGLKLKPAKGPGDVLVIDHVERPSEN